MPNTPRSRRRPRTARSPKGSRSSPISSSSSSSKRSKESGRLSIRYAVVGLGHIAQVAVLPAFANAKSNSVLAALVSDDARKRSTLARRYGVSRAVAYDAYDELLSSGEIDAVYIALPNTMHRDFTLRAAEAGIHVLCEKPMDATVDACEAMISGCRAAGVRLMIAYRLHFDVANLRAVEIARSGDLDQAYEYAEKREMMTIIDGKSRRMSYAKRDQFAAELVYFSRCIREGTEPEPSGSEGLADVRIIAALHRSIEKGRPVQIDADELRRHPTIEQRIDRPPVRKRSTVNAAAPSDS